MKQDPTLQDVLYKKLHLTSEIALIKGQSHMELVHVYVGHIQLCFDMYLF